MSKYLKALLIVVGFTNFQAASQNKYNLVEHPEFQNASNELPFSYVGEFEKHHYLLFSGDKGSVTLNEFNQSFVPTNRKRLVIGEINGEYEEIIYALRIKEELKIFTLTFNELSKTLRIYLKAVKLKTLTVSEPKMIATSEFRSLNGWGVLRTMIKEEGDFLYLTYVETKNDDRKEASLHTLKFDSIMNPVDSFSVTVRRFLIEGESFTGSDPKRSQRDFYFVRFGNDDFYIYRNLDDAIIVPFDQIEKDNFRGRDWQIESNKLRSFGYLESDNWIKGFLIREDDLLNPELSKIEVGYFNKDFISQYIDQCVYKDSERKFILKNGGLGLIHREVIRMSDGGHLVVLFHPIRPHELIFGRFDPNGKYEWVNFLKWPNIEYRGRAFEASNLIGDNIFLSLNDSLVIVRNSFVEELDNKEEYKNPKELSTNYSINLNQIHLNGSLSTSILTSFAGRDRYVIQPDRFFEMNPSSALLFSINENDNQKFRFMTLTAIE